MEQDIVNDVLELKDYLPLIVVVAGILFVIVGGLASNTWLEFMRKRKLKRRLALAFREEIQALLEVIEKRGYIEGLRSAKAQTEATGKFQAYHFSVRKKHFTVFETNMEQIETLGSPLFELINRFYSQANLILEDMQRFENLDSASIDPMDAIAAYDEVLNIFEDTVATGKRIVREISRRYLKISA
jgi:hypothetical protein